MKRTFVRTGLLTGRLFVGTYVCLLFFDSKCTDLRVVEHAQREFVDLVVDEIQNAPDEELAGAVAVTFASFVAINTFSTVE